MNELMNVEVRGNFIFPKDKFLPIGKIKGMSLYDLSRFCAETKHVIVFKVLKWECSVGGVGDFMRFFLDDCGYEKALREKEKGYIEIIEDKKVVDGEIFVKSEVRHGK